jgi:BRCA1-associated protein
LKDSSSLTADAQGAVSSEHPTNPKLVKELRGQRKPKKIQIETYANVLAADGSDVSDHGVLPKSSREQTPMDEVQPVADVPGELSFFSGNPFVEQTTGILHLYKSK